jgi:hypothetical protein
LYRGVHEDLTSADVDDDLNAESDKYKMRDALIRGVVAEASSEEA